MTEISFRNTRIKSIGLLCLGIFLPAAGTMHAQFGSNDVHIGRRLFISGEFGGNGRTCVTCHSVRTGDITLEHIQARFARNPLDPLFRAIDSDDGKGTTYNRVLTHATFRVFVDLPANIQLADDPTARHVALFRSTLPTNNITLDPFIMWDGRESDLPHQALSALLTHSEIVQQPTLLELQQIADFQRERLTRPRRCRSSPAAAHRRPFPRDTPNPSGADASFSSPRPVSSIVPSATAGRC